MKTKRIILIISFLIMVFSVLVIIETKSSNKINSLFISIFSGCIVSFYSLLIDYLNNLNTLKKMFYDYLLEYYCLLIQYKEFIKNYISNNEQITEKMFEYYTINVEIVYNKIMSLDESVYIRKEKIQELKDSLLNNKNSILNNSKIIKLAIIQKRLENIKEIGVERVLYVKDLKDEFEELYKVSENRANEFEKIIIETFNQKQKSRFENDKRTILEWIENYKYEKKIM